MEDLTLDKMKMEIQARFLKAAQNKQNLIEKYIREITPHYNEDMKKLRKFASDNKIPIIQHETEKFLSQIIKMNTPKNILEIGTAMGYSALVFANAMREGNIDTIEKDKTMISLAKENIQLAPKNIQIQIYEGDASEQLLKLQHKYANNDDICDKLLDKGYTSKVISTSKVYDFIFIDAAKAQYMKFLMLALPMLKDGGMIISDNIFYGGLTARNRYDVPRRQRTIHSRMREYLDYLMNDEHFDTSLLNIGDGIAMSVYRINGYRI